MQVHDSRPEVLFFAICDITFILQKYELFLE